MNRLLVSAYLCFFISLTAIAQDGNQELNAIFESIEAYDKKNPSPLDSLFKGHHVKSPFQKVETGNFMWQAEIYRGFVEKLSQIGEEQLTRQESISRRLMAFSLQHQIRMAERKYYLIQFNAEGGFYDRVSWAMGRLPFESKQDYTDYIGWFEFYAQYLDGHQKLMELGIKENMVAPKLITSNALKHMAPYASGDLEKHPFFQPFLKIPKGISEAEAEALKREGEKAVSEVIIPAYQKLSKFMAEAYMEAAKEKPGISEVAAGKELYAELAAYYTTLDISPDSIFYIGMAEVGRIRARMEEIIEEVGFEGDFASFIEFLRTDPQFYAKTPEELLYYAAWLSKKAEGQLPKLFHSLYNLPFTVEPVPEAIAPTYTAGRYVHGSMKQRQAGIYWVNTYKLEARPLYALPALTVHESVPGHHLQIALASELKDLPNFRKSTYFSAFGEGWGLYSEYLGEEMGMYETPYDRFGRYVYEMWRACRLVVDVGIHSKGWSREEAVDFLQSNTALSIHEVNTEIDRYIGWPGQALSYKIGEIKIRALRARAEKALGDRFDIRDFHQRLLQNGAVTLAILEQEIDRYIDEKKE